MAYQKHESANSNALLQEKASDTLDASVTGAWRQNLAARAAGLSQCPSLSPYELQKELRNNHELSQAAVPIMKEYEECFRKEHGILMLFSLKGTLLYAVGDPDLIRNPALQPGAVLKKKNDHEELGRWECFMEPLLGGKERTIGVLALLLARQDCHASTSALVHAIAANIHNQHHLHDLLSDQSTVLELLTDGIVILDRQGGIKAANAHARRIFGIPGEESISLGPVSDFVPNGQPFMQILQRKQTIMDEEVTLKTGTIQKRYILSASFIPEDKGVVCTLAETARMQKFAVRTAGSKAIYRFSDILGESDVIVNAVQLAKVAAQSDITTLLLGESGTGKELFAHAIHNGSARRNGPFVVVNCGALPRDLVQSELFGYEAGSFTGAAKNGKPGKFELADGGTIFLDEIGEMPLDAQTNLLRLIQNKEVARVGGTTTKSVDVRIVAATNRNLSEAVAGGTFRSDLFYRLSVLGINIPALRNRPTDISLLAIHFLHKYASALNRPITGFTPKALQILLHYTWPGNIRELENIIERAVNLAKDTLITESDLPDVLSARQEVTQPEPAQPRHEYTGANLYQREYQAIVDTLTHCNGNIRLTAQELGIARSALYGKLTRYGIDYTRFRNKYR